MSLKLRFGCIFGLIFCSFVDGKILSSIQAIDNNIDNETNESNNNQGRINLSMPGN